ncbi:hypothetical protein HOY80DRAFT_885032, partial [Tuber brumale]
LEADEHEVATVHGTWEGVDPDTVMDPFSSIRAKVLVSTNVMAGGIDVAAVTTVVYLEITPHQSLGAGLLTCLPRVAGTGRSGPVSESVCVAHHMRRLH